MAQPATGGGLGATIGAVLVALAVTAAVFAFINYTGGVSRHVRMVELAPSQRATAEQVAGAPSPPASATPG